MSPTWPQRRMPPVLPASGFGLKAGLVMTPAGEPLAAGLAASAGFVSAGLLSAGLAGAEVGAAAGACGAHAANSAAPDADSTMPSIVRRLTRANLGSTLSPPFTDSIRCSSL